MTEPKPHVGGIVGGHLFMIDQKYCSVYYRGVTIKETDKSFLIEDRNGNHTKVLKSNNYIVAPPDVDPETVRYAFETVKQTFAAGVRSLRDQLVAEQARQFTSSLAAMYQAAGISPDAEEIGTTSTV